MHSLARSAVRAASACGVRFQSTSALSRTPLHDFHVRGEHGGKMVEFAGYSMPLSYEGSDKDRVAGGPVAEHHQVRKSAGLFDVGHMVQTVYKGPGALGFLQRLLPASPLPVPDTENPALRATLSVLLNEQGGIIDDCMLTRWSADQFYLVTNAARAERDLTWIRTQLDRWNAEQGDSQKCEMEALKGWGLIALQGPKAADALQRLLPSNSLLSTLFSTSLFAPLSAQHPDVHIARGGYTGEDGFEISLPPQLTEDIAEKLVDMPEVKLAGLAARDSLRLEAGLCLYGHDLDESTGIGEANLNWVVGKDRRTPDAFIGAERTLAELKKGGSKRKRIGLVVEKGAPAREGAKIFDSTGKNEIGVVTSGLPSPTMGQNISMGYIETKDGLNKKGTEVMVEVRKKMRKAQVVSMPFVPTNYYRG